ncbi:ryncolin-1-like [Dendronephthya gigantea]|uniref:ryncolin-1-like n=1 Tax=Dendronephthya gigantea TaxID=151771 RepID=UPI0010693F68|nr:ryncolin-1-like [Dendronephthya gigantea]
MFKIIAFVGILFVPQISITRAQSCDKVKQDLASCCNVLKQNRALHGRAYDKVCRNEVKSCYDLYLSGVKNDGVYTIDPDGLGSFKVSCDMSKDGGGWTVFQRRQDGSQDFYLGWSDYKAGFGDLNGEFWLGLDKIHRLTKSGQNVLRVDLMDFNGDKRYAKYGKFSVADESNKYRLNIGSYSGNADDSLKYQNGTQFTTRDKDNDGGTANCAKRWTGGWWYANCAHSNLNGLYLGKGKNHYSGVHWRGWKMDSLKNVDMKMRPSLL